MNAEEVKATIKECLCNNLGIDAEILQYDTPLFGDGEIGLDSIDSLEIISFIDEKFGVAMSGVGKEHFRDVNSLAAYVCAHAEE